MFVSPRWSASCHLQSMFSSDLLNPDIRTQPLFRISHWGYAGLQGCVWSAFSVFLQLLSLALRQLPGWPPGSSHFRVFVPSILFLECSSPKDNSLTHSRSLLKSHFLSTACPDHPIWNGSLFCWWPISYPQNAGPIIPRISAPWGRESANRGSQAKSGPCLFL